VSYVSREIPGWCTAYTTLRCRFARTPKFEAANLSLAETADVAAVVWT